MTETLHIKNTGPIKEVNLKIKKVTIFIGKNGTVYINKDLSKLREVFNFSNPKELGISIGKNCYKYRLKNSDNQKGKSGGYRVIYFYISGDTITLISIYSKSELENIEDSDIIERLKEIF